MESLQRLADRPVAARRHDDGFAETDGLGGESGSVAGGLGEDQGRVETHAAETVVDPWPFAPDAAAGRGEGSR